MPDDVLFGQFAHCDLLNALEDRYGLSEAARLACGKVGLETYQKLMEKGAIEVAPLAYMRGRTLSNAFVILDEAQNATREQMKMFLTRLGEGSKMVVTGDLTQTDLPEGKTSGLKQAVSILKGVEDIAVCKLTEKDVVRHPLVAKIVRAYEATEQRHKKEERA